MITPRNENMEQVNEDGEEHLGMDELK